MLFAVYGSLRIGEFNYSFVKKAYGEDGLIPICKAKIKGYRLYSLGDFPGAVKQEQADGIVVDVMAASSEVAAFIDNMEKTAGYKPKIARWGKHSLVFYALDKPEDYWPLVPDGDWSKYLRARKEQMKEYAQDFQD